MTVEWLLYPLWVDYNLIGQLGKEVKQQGRFAWPYFGSIAVILIKYIHSSI